MALGPSTSGRFVRDVAVMLADGGDCLADPGTLGDQAPWFGDVASTSTAFRTIDRMASDPTGWLCRLRVAHAVAGSLAWALIGARTELIIDLDATLIRSHSDKEGAGASHALLDWCHEGQHLVLGGL